MCRFWADQLIADIQKQRDEARDIVFRDVGRDMISHPLDQGPRLRDSADGGFLFRAQQDVLEVLRCRDGRDERRHFP